MLRIHARPGHLVPWPGQKVVGQPVRYIGRGNKVTDSGVEHRARAEAVEIDPNSDAGRKVIRLSAIEHDKPFWPADTATAAALGLPFVPVELVDGEWVERASAPAKAKAAPSGKKDGDQ